MANPDLDAFERDLRALASGLQQQETLERVGLAQEKKIRERTRKGLDYLEDAFAPYAESYKPRREKKELPTSTVNLEFSLYDGMLTYLSTEVDAAEGTVTVSIFDEDKAEIAGYHNRGEGDNPQREFIGVSDEDAQDIADLMGQEVDALLQKLDLST